MPQPPWLLSRLREWSRPRRRPGSARRCGRASTPPHPRAVGSAGRAPAGAGRRRRRMRRPTRRARREMKLIPASVRGEPQRGQGRSDPDAACWRGASRRGSRSPRSRRWRPRPPGPPDAPARRRPARSRRQCPATGGSCWRRPRAAGPVGPAPGWSAGHRVVHRPVDRRQLAERFRPARCPTRACFGPPRQGVADGLLAVDRVRHARIVWSARRRSALDASPLRQSAGDQRRT